MPKKTTALVLNVKGAIRISYHPNADAAEAASKKTPNYDAGFIAASAADMEPDKDGDAVELPLLRKVAEKLGGDTDSMDDIAEARNTVWHLLLANLPDNPEYADVYGAAETATASQDEDDEAVNPAPEPEEESEVSETNVEVARKPARRAATPVKATPAKATKVAPPAKAAAGKKPTPAPKQSPAHAAAAAKKPAPVAAKKTAAPTKAAAPAKKTAAATASNGDSAGGSKISPVWVSILRELGKKGDKGMTRVELKDLASEKGAGPYFKRFVNAGVIDRIGRGQFKLSAAGKAAIAK